MKIWTDGGTDGEMDGHTDSQCETIIPCHYLVAGYKKGHNSLTNLIKRHRMETIFLKYGMYVQTRCRTYRQIYSDVTICKKIIWISLLSRSRSVGYLCYNVRVFMLSKRFSFQERVSYAT